jgi:hypothetical protein
VIRLGATITTLTEKVRSNINLALSFIQPVPFSKNQRPRPAIDADNERNFFISPLREISAGLCCQAAFVMTSGLERIDHED